MKIGNFFGKGTIFEISQRIVKFFENRGEILNRGENASWSQGGMDAPGYWLQFGHPKAFLPQNLAFHILKLLIGLCFLYSSFVY